MLFIQLINFELVEGNYGLANKNIMPYLSLIARAFFMFQNSKAGSSIVELSLPTQPQLLL